MALTKTPIELSSTPSIVDGGNATAITIDSSENVGIGVSNPSDYYAADLVVTGPSEGGITIASTGNHTNYLLFADSTSGVSRYAGMIGYAHDTDTMSFRTNSIQRMAIDSSGSVLVGKTSTGDYVTGIEMQPAGAILSYRTGGVASIFGRTDAGEITRFTRGTSIIGRIGTTTSAGGTRFAIGGTGDPGIIFAGTGVFPATEITASDNVSDLGSGNYRWKDLYLSGGAYLGGTAAANKLEDYEEGTWTPVPVGLGDSGGTYSGFYTKTGRIVNWSCYIVLPSTADTSFGVFGGLPFASTGGQGTTGNSGVSYKNSTTDLQILVNQSTATMFWYNSAGAQQTYANLSGKSLYMGGSYITDL